MNRKKGTSAICLSMFCNTNLNSEFFTLFTREQQNVFSSPYCIITVSFILQLVVRLFFYLLIYLMLTNCKNLL